MITCRWDGENLKPMGDADLRWCTEHYAIGMMYRLDPYFPRDDMLMKAKFAAIGEAFKQLPHKYDGLFRNAEHFRKYLLVKEGFCTTEYFMCENPNEAKHLAMSWKRRNDNPRDNDFSIIFLKGNIVQVSTPFSMGKSMPDGEFKEVANKIIECAAHMVGVTVDELRSNAGKSA